MNVFDAKRIMRTTMRHWRKHGKGSRKSTYIGCRGIRREDSYRDKQYKRLERMIIYIIEHHFGGNVRGGFGAIGGRNIRRYYKEKQLSESEIKRHQSVYERFRLYLNQ